MTRDGAPRLTRRQWLATLAGATVVGSAANALAIEPNRVTVTRHRVGDGDGPLLRIVQLSDLHLRSVGRHEERIARAVHDLRPDMIVLTGDAVDRDGNLHLLGDFLSLLPQAGERLAIVGNWEHWAGIAPARLEQLYDRHGWRLLLDESVRVRTGAAELLVTGMDDLVGGAPDTSRALADAAPCANHLLLAHCPTHRERFRAGAPDGRLPADVDPRLLSPALMLAGHTHGGQVTLLGWAPLRPPGSGRYVSGWYRDSPTALYVSRGLGTSVVPARFRAPPEVACFEWALAAG